MHTNPTSMPQNKAAIIISEYEGNKIDWGIIIGEGVRAALASFQSGKKLLSVMTHFLTVLYPPPSTSPHRTLTSPPPRKQRERILPITQEEWEEPTPNSPPSAARNPTPISAPPAPKTKKQRALPDTCEEWDEAEGAVTEDVTIRHQTPT